MSLSHLTTEKALADYLQSSIDSLDNELEQISKEAQQKIADLKHKARARNQEARSYKRKLVEKTNLRHEARVFLAEADKIEEDMFDAQLEGEKERGRIIDAVEKRKKDLLNQK